MKYFIRSAAAVLCLLFCFFSGQAVSGAENMQQLLYEEYGTELRRGTLVVKADASSSIVRDWTAAPVYREEEFQGDIREFVFKQTQITDGHHTGDPLGLRIRILFDKKEKEPRPAILFIPGGGFMSSSLDRGAVYYNYLACHGYVAAVMEYRTIGEGRYMDGMADIRDAIRYLRAHAEEFGIDPERIGLFGASAGGHLASLAAVASDRKEFRGSDNLSFSHQIQAVVSLYATSDLTRLAMDFDAETQAFHKLPQACEAQYVHGVLSGLGILDDPEEAELADPMHYLNGSEPPFLQIHGEMDNLISPSMSLLLHEALLAQNDVSVRYLLKGENHGTQGFVSEPAMHLIRTFYDRELKNRKLSPF